MRTGLVKYIAVICLLFAILESNHIPVISVFGKYTNISNNIDNGNTEDPVKESENLRVETVKDYLHQFTWFNFAQPVFLLPVKHPLALNAKFPYNYYPEVPTPPPTC